MNTLQKAAFAASALVITLVGSALATAPLAFAHPMHATAYAQCPAAALQQTLSHPAGCTAVTGKTALIVLNRR